MEKKLTINISPKTVLLFAAVAIGLWLVFALKEIIVLFFLAFIFSTALDPAIDRLEKKKIPRTLAILGIYVLVVIFFVLLFRAIIPPAVSQFSELNANRELYIDKLMAYLSGTSPQIRETIQAAMVALANTFVETGGAELVTGAFGIFSGLLGLVVILAVGFYMLLEKDGPERAISSYVPKAYQAKTLSIAKKITKKMSLWFRGQLFLGFTIFLMVYIGLSVLRINFALPLAIIAGFMELLPVIGPLISGGLAALVALATSPVLALIVIVLFIFIQQLENHILVPQIMKKAVGLHPVAVILALLIGGKLMGILGIIIAVPVFASIAVIFNELYKSNL